MNDPQKNRVSRLKGRTLVALARGFGFSPKNAAQAVEALAGLPAEMSEALDAALTAAENAEASPVAPGAEPGLESADSGQENGDSPEPPAEPETGWIKVLRPKFKETIWYNNKPYPIQAGEWVELPVDVARHTLQYLEANGIPCEVR